LAANKLDCETQNILGEMWQEAYESGGSLSFRIASGSMSPTIEIGDVVEVIKAQPSEIRLGDVVAFREGKYVFVHRIIGKSLSNQQIIFRQMGDAGVSSKTIEEQNIIGRVSVIKKDGHGIFLDKRRYLVSKRIQVWRLRLVDSLSRMRRRHINMGLRIMLRPAWRLCRSILFRHF